MLDATAILDAAAWSSPNGATWTIKSDGTRITAYGSNHPVIVLGTSASTAAQDYTVTATVKSPADGAPTREFGLYARGLADGGGGLVLGSEYGGETKPSIAPMTSPSWNPLSNSFGAVYTYKAATRYKMKLKVVGTTASGKIWEATAMEPAAFQVTGTAPSASGKLAGFYTYLLNGAVLETIAITTP